MECRDRLENYLRENQVPFEEQHHPRAVSAQKWQPASTSPEGCSQRQ